MKRQPIPPQAKPTEHPKPIITPLTFDEVESTSGFLVTPNEQAETLSEIESKIFVVVLRWLRGEAKGMAAILRHFAEIDREDFDEQMATLDGAMSWIYNAFGWIKDDPIVDPLGYPQPGVEGLVFSNEDKSPIRLYEDEAKAIVATVKAFRKGGWFGEWLYSVVDEIGHGPASFYPTPMYIAGTLAGHAARWDNAIEKAREIASKRPDLLADMVAEAQTKGSANSGAAK